MEKIAAVSARVGHALENVVIGFAAAGSEDDFIRCRPEKRSDLPARLGDPLLDHSAHGVRARRVSVVLTEVGYHRVDRGRVGGRGRVVVKIDHGGYTPSAIVGYFVPADHSPFSRVLRVEESSRPNHASVGEHQ